MKVLLTVAFLVCASCKTSEIASNTFSHNGAVFKALSLPSPNTTRAASGAPGFEYWQQESNHDIEVELNTETNLIVGSQRITYTNTSPDVLTYMWFHLEQNVLREDSIRSRGGRASGEKEFSGIEISSFSIDGEDVKMREYGTVGRVELIKPITPGDTIEIDISWTFPFPLKGGMRMGYDDSPEAGPIWEFAQWVPVPCVYDDVHGWNNLPYIGSGEFYTNFGDYNVAITVPYNHLVFGSGVLTNPREVLTSIQQARLKTAMKSDKVIVIHSADEVGEETSRPVTSGTLTWKFKGDNIRTFAWGSSASYMWDAASVEVTSENGSVSRVLCQAAYPIEEKDIWEDAVTYVQHSIQYYSERIYPYPWPQMAVIFGSEGGMEYPMLVYCRSGSKKGLFSVTDHEVCHSWFPMLINNDERRHAWMDEGFNTFFNNYSKLEYYEEDTEKYSLKKYKAERYTKQRTPINTPADHLRSRGHLSYHKPAYGLRLLREEIMGEERFDFAFDEYVKRWVFKSPRPADFYRTMEDASGMDLQWFFRGFFEEALLLDQAIVSVSQKESKDKWKVRVALQNKDSWVCPVDLTFKCEDESVHTFLLPESIWFWSNRHKQSFEFDSRVVQVIIDAREVYPDISRSNNVFYVNE